MFIFHWKSSLNWSCFFIIWKTYDDSLVMLKLYYQIAYKSIIKIKKYKRNKNALTRSKKYDTITNVAGRK